MYTRAERQEILEQLTVLFSSIEEVRGAVLLGSGSIGFLDEFSDLDFMLGVNNGTDSLNVKEMILNKLKEMGYQFGKIVEFRRDIILIVAILENFLELDISICPVNDLVARSNQWKVLFDKDETVYKKMSDEWNNRPIYNVIEIIDNNNLIVETTYLIRRSLMELARGNFIYAANLSNEIRENILLVECLIEGKKVHQFKNYMSLDEKFKDKLELTYVLHLDKLGILEAIIECKNLFFELIKSITNDNEFLKYENYLLDYINDLF